MAHNLAKTPTKQLNYYTWINSYITTRFQISEFTSFVTLCGSLSARTLEALDFFMNVQVDNSLEIAVVSGRAMRLNTGSHNTSGKNDNFVKTK